MTLTDFNFLNSVSVKTKNRIRRIRVFIRIRIRQINSDPYGSGSAKPVLEQTKKYCADPNTFLLDHLLQLKPVKFLEGELIHDLLSIFVSEKLEAYIRFYESHKEFVNGLGLKHEDNIRKMKLLTFMQMAENRSEITFQVGEQE